MARRHERAELPGTRPEPLECDIETIKKPLGSDAARRSRLKRLDNRGQTTRAELAELRDLYADA